MWLAPTRERAHDTDVLAPETTFASAPDGVHIAYLLLGDIGIVHRAFGHPGAQLAFLGVGRIGAGLGKGLAGGTPVHVDVLHADQPRAGGLGGCEHPGLQGGEQLHPLGG